MNMVICRVSADNIQGYPWDHHLQGVRGCQQGQQLRVVPHLPSPQSLLCGPEENMHHRLIICKLSLSKPPFF